MFNLEKLNFSAPGAYLSICKERRDAGAGIWIRTLIRPCFADGKSDPSDRVMRILPAKADGTFCAYTVDFLPHKLVFKLEDSGTSSDAFIEVFFSDWEALSFRAHNAGVVLEYGHGDNLFFVPRLDPYKDSFRFTAYLPVTFYEVSVDVAGTKTFTHDTNYCRLTMLPENAASFTAEFRAKHKRVPESERTFPYKNPDDLLAAFNEFCAHFPKACENGGTAPTSMGKIAAYILFSIRYEKRGLYKRDSCAASKGKLNLVWNWDNCFIALAEAKADTKLCWDSILMFFENQRENGQLPDAINPLMSVDWYLKPPVHGFFVEWLLDAGLNPAETDREFLYAGLVRWTQFWQNEFCLPNGLFYYKHGNDSGWDNATCFDSVPVVTPDLNAYLILQMHALSRLALLLGKNDESKNWKEKALSHTELFVNALWSEKEKAFMCAYPDGRQFKSTSLIRMLPIILGKKLPPHILASLAAELKTENHFLTPRGFATESVKSPLYDQRRGGSASAYWRGAIWAPSTILLLKGLVRAGETGFAKEAASRYLHTLESQGETFYENYDALINVGYDDFGFGWTAASYVLLKDEKFFTQEKL